MKKLLFSVLLVFAFSLPLYAQPMEIPSDSKCDACGMKVDPESPFSAEIIDKSGKLHAFCDIGDMASSYAKMKDTVEKIYVRDYSSKKWIDAKSAFYSKSDNLKSPMGWNIAAFASKEDASKYGEPMTFEKLIESISTMPKKQKMMMH